MIRAPQDILDDLNTLKENSEELVALIEKTIASSIDVNEMYLILEEAEPIGDAIKDQLSEIIISLDGLGESADQYENDILDEDGY